MSQSPKKPGARDISDLKARLGLKKGGSPATRPTGVPPPMGGGAIPSPTAAKAAVPAPPGTPEAEMAARGGIPDARKDPFGAMNAIAAQSAAAAAPEIVVVNDGKPVESVGVKSKLGLLKLIAPALVALAVGMIVGQMGTNANIYNQTIDDAATVGDIVKKVDKDLQNLRNVLYTAKGRGARGQNYVIADKELTAELEALTLEMPDLNRVYESNLYTMDQGVVDQTMAYLTETGILYKQIKDHVLKAKTEGKALASVPGRLERFGLLTRYAVIVDIPKGDDAASQPVSATFVELGDMVCQDGKPNPNGCAEAPKGFLYRRAEMGLWGQKSLAIAEDNYIPGNRLIRLGFEPSRTLIALFKGGEATVSQVTYKKRIMEIDAKLDNLMERGKTLRKAFTSVANQNKQFTFFM